MNFFANLSSRLADGRFAANLIVFYGMIVVTFVGSLMLRRLLSRGGTHLASATGSHWLGKLGDAAAHRARKLLYWITLAVLSGIVALGVGYHYVGGDVREDLFGWMDKLTAKELLRLGCDAGSIVGVLISSFFVVRLVRRLRPGVEALVFKHVGRPANEETLRTWFRLLERYLVFAIRLATVWAASQVVGLGSLADTTIGFVFRVLSILVVSRLLTLACGALSKTVSHLGDRHLGQGQFRHYWERILRLLPFGERCCEAAVYIQATSLCVREFHFIAVIADLGPHIVECIGILFGTRVLIELVQVLLNESFGLYDEERQIDQKGRTLVPLLHSICQYVLYFGSFVVMLGVLGVNTAPILAGAGILGLGVGLGAQNLVTDVVSGFFILFESQYLVGDLVQIGDACGTVEAVGIRLTQIRDDHGKLFLIPNGQIKGVVNLSKDFVNAVVDYHIPSGSDLEGVMRAMAEAGRRLKQAHKEVLSDTKIHGVVELNTSELTVRAVTKVQPGTHTRMENEYRRLLKHVFDENQAAAAA